MASDYPAWIPVKVAHRLSSWRQSRKLILFMVFLAYFLDYTLMTMIVAIIPDVLYKLDHSEILINATTNANESESTNQLANNITNEDARHQYILDESIAIGLLYASMPIAEVIVTPFIGPLTNRIGHGVPMFSGFVIMFVTTIIFAFGETYTVLFVARAMQGIGTACTSISGMSLLADIYADDEERGIAIGFALTGLALGTTGVTLRFLDCIFVYLVFLYQCSMTSVQHLFVISFSSMLRSVYPGPPFGGVMYQFVGKEAPFLILAGLILLGGLLLVFAIKVEARREDLEGTPIIELIKDPYILIVAGAHFIVSLTCGFAEPALPLWMIDNMNAPEWQQGVVFLPSCLTHLMCTSLCGQWTRSIGRWLSTLIGLLVIGTSFLIFPFCKTFYLLLVPSALWGIGSGMIEVSIWALLGNLVDLRHVSVYGSAYAIADFASCIGFAGSAINGPIVNAVGFHWLMWMTALIAIVYAPLTIFLRNPPSRAEKQTLITDESGKKPVSNTDYNSMKYQQFDENDDNGNGKNAKEFDR